MDYIKTEIEGVFIIEPKVFCDARGYFMEAWKLAEFNEHVGRVDFIHQTGDLKLDMNVEWRSHLFWKTEHRDGFTSRMSMRLLRRAESAPSHRHLITPSSSGGRACQTRASAFGARTWIGALVTAPHAANADRLATASISSWLFTSTSFFLS